MFANYLKTALRHLRRHPLYAFINIFGLAVGLAFVVLIFLFVKHEFSYDRFHARADRIFRVHEVEYELSGVEESYDLLGYPRPTEGIDKSPWLPTPLGDALLADLPEIRRYSRYDQGNGIVRHDRLVEEEDVYYVDSTFLEMFSFPLLAGDPETVLDRRESVVLTPEMAEKYFGTVQAVGRPLEIEILDSAQVFTVTGIVKPPPAPSSLPYGILMRIERKPNYARNYERWNSFNTPLFVELQAGVGREAFQQKLDAFVNRQFEEMIQRWRDRNQLAANDPVFRLGLTPLVDLHLDTSVRWIDQGSATNMVLLCGIALLVLLIACLNYIALALTAASGRALEVGVRKVMGSTRRMVARQFWLEAQMLVLVAMLGAVGMVEFFLPTFNRFVQRELDFDLATYGQLLLPLIFIALITGLLAGSYPALVLARSRAVRVLKGNQTYRHRPGFIRVAVVVQFALSVFLILSSVIMYRQMRYVNTMDLGFRQEEVLVVPTYTGWNDKGERLVERLRGSLRDDPSIRRISGTSASFTRGYDRRGFDMPNGDMKVAYVYRVDEHYLDAMGIELVAGRNFSPEHPTDPDASIIVNQTLLQDLNLPGDPLGQEVPWRDSLNRVIVGVVEDYHFLSLTEEIQPLILHTNNDAGKVFHALVQVDGDRIPEALAAVEAEWRALAPDKPFNYSFLDEDVARQYENFQRWMRIMGVSTVFAIFIACLGLFGLAGMLAVNKTKEIGIRKVLGASMGQVLLMLNKDLFRLAAISLLLAAPAAWWAMRTWLDNFAYAVQPGWEIYVLSGLACLVLVLVTVSYHALRAASRNPVEALRYE